MPDPLDDAGTPRPPTPGQVEHLHGGDDAPGPVERVAAALGRHPVATVAVVAVLAAAAVAALLVARPWQHGSDPTTPDGVSVRVGRTDSIGTVVEEGPEPVVRIEAKVDLAGPAGSTGRVRGLAGPGVMESRSSMPPLAAGSSVVGLLTARVRCDDVVGRDEGFTVTVDVTSGERTGRVDAELDRLARPWRELLRRACGG